MRNRTPWLTSRGLPLAVGLILLLAGGAAEAGDSGEPGAPVISSFGPAESLLESPTAAPLSSLRLPGSTLKPREDDVSYTVGSSGACTYVTAGDADTVWNHKLTLPQGAVIDTLRMYYYDTSGSNSSAWFTVHDLYGSIVQEWSVASSGSSGNSFNDSAAIGHVVDYAVYSYALNWRPIVSGSSMQLCGFRIFYVDPLIFDDDFESGDTSGWSASQP